MVLTAFGHIHLRLVGLLLLGLLWSIPLPGIAAEEAQPVAEQEPEVTYPGLSEVVPQSIAEAAKIGSAEVQINQIENLTEVYAKIEELAATLESLESQYTDWEDAANWPLNRLAGAENKYEDLSQQVQKPLDTISEHVKELEDLRSEWAERETYWRTWQKTLQDQKVKIPAEAFRKTRQAIDALLQRINKVSTDLVNAQQKYSPIEEVIDSRLILIDKALDTLRLDAFRQTTYSLFEADFYRQFDEDLFSQLTNNIGPTLSLPDGFFKRYAAPIVLQAVMTLLIIGLLVYRMRQTKPITPEWKFLFRRPLAGGIFITIFMLMPFGTSLYRNIPPSWKWLMTVMLTVAVIRLLTAIYEKPLGRKILRILAVLFVLTETLQLIGLPLPLLQIYNVLVCIIALPACWTLARRHQKTIGKADFPSTAMYVISAVALVGLVASTFGYVSLTSNLIDATLSTLILVLLVQMALRLIDGGIIALMGQNWVRDRKFILHLGVQQTTHKIQTLAHIVLYAQSVLYLLVAWRIFDTTTEARTTLMQLEYNLGEFSISLEMLIMVAIVLYATLVLTWLIQAFLDTQVMIPRGMDVGVRASMKRLAQYGLYTIGFLIAISMAGIELQKFTILAGAFGVGIGFGLQNIVNNFVSGLILLFERPVKVGDQISLDDQWCQITKIGLRSTIVETFDKAEVIVPNSDLISQKVTNWTYTNKTSRIVIPVGVAYGSELAKVLEILDRVGNDNPYVLSDPPVSTIFVGFGNSSLDFELRVWVSEIEQRLKVKSDLCLEIDRSFREAGVEIPFPQRDLHLRSIDTNLQTLFKPKTPSGSEGQTE